jgi:hypothetical protein
MIAVDIIYLFIVQRECQASRVGIFESHPFCLFARLEQNQLQTLPLLG